MLLLLEDDGDDNDYDSQVSAPSSKVLVRVSPIKRINKMA